MVEDEAIWSVSVSSELELGTKILLKGPASGEILFSVSDSELEYDSSEDYEKS